MNKKVYLQPQIKCAPLLMENLLASLSRTEGGNTLGDSKTDIPEMGTPGTDTGAKEHWGSFDNWDSWE